MVLKKKCFFYNFSCQATFTNHSGVPWSIRGGFNYPIKSQLLTWWLCFLTTSQLFRSALKWKKLQWNSTFLHVFCQQPWVAGDLVSSPTLSSFIRRSWRHRFLLGVSVDVELKNQPPGLFGMFDDLTPGSPRSPQGDGSRLCSSTGRRPISHLMRLIPIAL